MKVLVAGKGGREDALTWKLVRDGAKVFCAPGNAGMAKYATCVPIEATDIDALSAFAIINSIDLTVVGPEAPLVDGIVNRFRLAGRKIVGPTKEAAELEGSKSFAKDFMRANNISTAPYWLSRDPETAKGIIRREDRPLVIKFDQLAGGHGVIVPKTVEEALTGVDTIASKYGTEMVLEEVLKGRECSFHVLTDGETVIDLETSGDRKALYEEDLGPNTGSMGSFCPSVFLDWKQREYVMKQIVYPTVRGMEKAGRPFTGVLYFNLMIVGEKIYVLEINNRFGDSETQAIMPRLKSSLLELLWAQADCALYKECDRVYWFDRASVCVNLVSGGYPGEYSIGHEIRGIEEAEALGAIVFHAGTKEVDGKILTDGGRVINVVGLGRTFAEANGLANRAAKVIDFKDKHYRKDIAVEAVKFMARNIA